MDPIQFVIELMKWGIAAYLVLLLGRAVAARIAGEHAESVLDSSLITIPITVTLALPHHNQKDNDQELAEETGNRETPDNTGNSGETPGETPDDAGLMTLGYAGEQHLAPRMSRQEHHELIKARNEAIGLLDRCVKYYREKQKTDDGVIPRHDKIHMQPELRGTIVDSLWYSQWVVKAPNKTSVDPAYFPTCNDLMLAIRDGRARVYPMGYLERKQAMLNEAVQALPELERNDHV